MKTIKILIAGGDPDTVQLCLALLKRAGLQYAAMVVEPGCGSDALRLIKGFSPDLIMIMAIQDLQPNGLELCRLLRAERGLEKTRMIIFSAYRAEEFRDRALEAGADAYIEKPFDVRVFTKTIKDMLG